LPLYLLGAAQGGEAFDADTAAQGLGDSFRAIQELKAMATKKTKKKLPELMPVALAAQYLKISRQTIWAAIKRGRIKAQHFDHVVLISRDSIEEYKKTRKPAPPRRKQKKK
jgi:excisionase family DNA binding protein